MDLAQLRTELDTLDREILEAVARRTEIVRAIAEAKAATPTGKPLFDRDREREVYARARAQADTVGLDPVVAHLIMQVLVESSHRIQEEASRRAAIAQASVEAKRFLIVGGHGRMGRRLGATLAERGHDVDVRDLDDPRELAAAVGPAEIVLVAVPMAVAAETVETLGPYVAPDALLCDINSLKEEVCAAMARTCRGEALGLHPMFGPTVHSLRRQKVVVCPVKPGPRADWLRRELGAVGLDLIETDPVTHDKMMAVVQVLVHFSTLVMGEALRHTGVSIEESLRFTSPIYRLELAFIGRLFAQSPDLYAEIEMTNPHSEEVRRAFLRAAASMSDIIGRGDREEFRESFEGVSRYFHEFAGEAMQLSDFIIDQMVRQP